MPTYKEIETAYTQVIDKLATGDSRTAREKVMNSILLDQEDNIPSVQDINVRLYFNANETLVGLAEWADGFDS